MSDLSAILAKSKGIMDKTKNLPRGMFSEDGNGNVNAKKVDVMSNSTPRTVTPSLSESIGGQNIISENYGANPDFNFTESNYENSRLPKEVLMAMRESAKDRQNINFSVTANVDASKINKQNTSKNVITEQVQTQQPIQVTNSSSIDYSLIKMIVEECVKKQIGGLKKSILSENRVELPETMVQQGNTFKFVTKDGKIFEGKLTYKGNINDK